MAIIRAYDRVELERYRANDGTIYVVTVSRHDRPVDGETVCWLLRRKPDGGYQKRGTSTVGLIRAWADRHHMESIDTPHYGRRPMSYHYMRTGVPL